MSYYTEVIKIIYNRESSKIAYKFWCLLQPMPGKHTLLAQLDRYSKEFVIARMKLLHIFLNRVVNHPIISCDKNLHIFLTTKPAVSNNIISLKYNTLYCINLNQYLNRNSSFTAKIVETYSLK